MPKYVVIGGGAYQPGSAAAKRAQQLYDARAKPATPSNIFATPAPRTATPQFGPGWQRGLLADQPNPLPPNAAPVTPRTDAAPPNTIQNITPRTVLNDIPSMGTGPGGSNSPDLTGSPGMTGMGAFGLVPPVPSPIATAGASIGGNIGNLPALGQLGVGTTGLSAQLAQMPYLANLPNYAGMLGQASEGIASNLAGVINPQEWNQLQTRMGERGVSMGMGPGSQNANTALAIGLDRDIRQQQALGQQQFNAAIGRTPTGQPFNIAGQQIGPGDMQAAQYAANVAGAAPDPAQAAQANLEMLLRSIEAGRVGGLGGVGGGGGGGSMPIRSGPSAPGIIMPQVSYGGAGGAPVSGWSRRAAPVAPGAAAPSAPIDNSVYPMMPTQGTIAEPGTVGGSVFDPYSLGGYNFTGQPTAPDAGTEPTAPETGTPDYTGTELDPWTQQFLDQFGIDWSLPDYASP